MKARKGDDGPMGVCVEGVGGWWTSGRGVGGSLAEDNLTSWDFLSPRFFALHEKLLLDKNEKARLQEKMKMVRGKKFDQKELFPSMRGSFYKTFILWRNLDESFDEHKMAHNFFMDFVFGLLPNKA